jgi:hypothetical protein
LKDFVLAAVSLLLEDGSSFLQNVGSHLADYTE